MNVLTLILAGGQGSRLSIPANASIGRNCRIDPSTSQEDYDQLEVPSGSTISRRD